MAHTKAMGIGAMFVLLVVAVILLPIIVSYVDRMDVHYSISAFQDLAAAHAEGVTSVPSAAGSMSQHYVKDSNTDYMCRSPNDGGQPCPEGTFCDGSTQSCVNTYVGGPVPDTGYFA